MNTYVFFLLSLFCVNFAFSMDSTEPLSAESFRTKATSYQEVERQSLDAVTFSKNEPRLNAKFCEHVISCAPKRVQEEIITLCDPQTREDYYTNAMALYGPAGGGKSTLAKVIAQQIGTPYFHVEGGLLANEYANSGKAALLRLAKLAVKEQANVVVDEFDALARIKKNSDKTESEQDVSRAFWEILDILEANKLLIIMTANNLENFPEPLQSRLEWCLFEVPLVANPAMIRNSIVLHLGAKKLDSPNAILDRFSKQLLGYPNRCIKKIVLLAAKNALHRNRTNPVITTLDFEAAMTIIKEGRKVIRKTNWDKEKTLQYASQVAAIAGCIMSAITLYNNFASVGLQKQSVNIAHEGLVNQSAGLALQGESVQIAREGLGLQYTASEMQKASLLIAREGIKMQRTSLYYQKWGNPITAVISLLDNEFNFVEGAPTPETKKVQSTFGALSNVIVPIAIAKIAAGASCTIS